ncbi:hypothetical protein [Streptomyces sp. IGB124]|uniref:hypothetical protein n=1 Tax=Streptomyces sp. IGB124 TaxID=1519485 RepID=UPI0006AF2E0D|nr:hypothetical protein [Streptomyces sp. IGB124]KOU61364.1 hypothetical protein ADK96_28650 [Streptomyces sp. IGB124]
MAATTTAHDTGTICKRCGHALLLAEMPPRLEDPIPQRGREADRGIAREKAAERLSTVHNEKQAKPANQAKAERIARYGQMRFDEYTEEWKQGQRHLAPASLSHPDSLLQHHIFPALSRRRMITFTAGHRLLRYLKRRIERLTRPHARQSQVLRSMLTSIALCLAGRPGARLATALGIRIAKDELLDGTSPPPTPRN